MIVFRRNRLEPNLGHQVSVNDMNVRRFTRIRRVESELVPLNLDCRHDSSCRRYRHVKFQIQNIPQKDGPFSGAKQANHNPGGWWCAS
jgi:hypothetical protein